MKFSRNKADFVQQLNTKGCCFLCLDTEDENTEAIRHLVSIRSLLRHLQIKCFEMEVFNGKDIQVDLCEACENILMGFITVLEELEKVQMKMNYLLERINKTISGSKKDSERLQVYSKRMTDDAEALAQLAFVDNLRKKLATKSLVMQVGPIPKINLERIEGKKIQVKEEVDCSKEMNETGENVFDDEDQQISDPEPAIPSFPPLEPPPEPIKREEANLKTKEVKPDKSKKSRRDYYHKVKETGMYQCRKCDKNCKSRRGIVDHYQRVHLQKRLKCDICSISSYVGLYDLKVHKKTCRETLEERLAKEKERNVVCDLCRKRFRCKTGLRVHQQSVHKNIDRYACNLCDKKYTKLCSLKEHMDSVHLGKVFHCRFCKKGYRFKSRVNRHQKICDQKKQIKTESAEK